MIPFKFKTNNDNSYEREGYYIKKQNLQNNFREELARPLFSILW